MDGLKPSGNEPKVWPTPVASLCLSPPSPSRPSSRGPGAPACKGCGGQDWFSAGQTGHTLKGGERSETGEPHLALEMEFICGMSWIPGGQNVWLTWRGGTPLRPPSPSPQPGNMGVSPLQVCPREMPVSRGLCVLVCPLRPTDRPRQALGQQGGGGGGPEEGEAGGQPGWRNPQTS